MNRKQIKAEKERLLLELTMLEPTSEEYHTTIQMYVRLDSLKPRFRPSPDAILALIGTLGSVLLIVAYEQKHVFASKAQGFIPKAK
jgi:hypothetical protein